MDEFTVYLIGDLVISAIVAAFTYGLGPVTIAVFWGRPIQKKKFKIFCIIYTIVVWFAWQMYRESSGNSVSIVPAILWGYVSYLIARKTINKKYDGQCKAEQKTAELELEQQNALPEPEEAKSEQPVGQPAKETEIQRWYTCPKCGQLVKDGEECDCEAVKLALEEEREKKEEQKQQKRQALKKALPLYAVCAVLLVVVCALGFYSYNLKRQVDELSIENAALTNSNNKLSSESKDNKTKIQELNSDKKRLEEKYSNLLDDYSNDIDLIYFYYNRIGLIVNGSNRYHRFDCKIFQDSDNFWAHNIEYCEDIGYSKCPECW